MKTLVLLILCASSSCLFAQLETAWWSVGNNVLVDFNSGTPIQYYSGNCYDYENTASISDNLGNLLYYSEGDTLWDGNNLIVPNGTNFTSNNNGNGLSWSTTQGSLFIKKPNSANIYYLFSMGSGFKSKLEYAVINQNTSAILSKNNMLFSDTLSEKMTASMHCNGRDIWLTVINNQNINSLYPLICETEFLSYLITENGVQPTPIKSKMVLNRPIPFLGQLKFNSKGDKLATADGSGINLFSFDKETGEVSFFQRIPLNLQNGYGVEFSPDDKLLYINEKQYDFQTGVLTPLLNYSCPSQLQRGMDGKIYKMHMPSIEIINSSVDDNGFAVLGNSNNSFRLTQINQPNISGVGCLFDTNFIYDQQPNYNGFSLALPNFPSFYFNHPIGEFSYSGNCINTPIEFSLVSPNATIDSIQWHFSDNDQLVSGINAFHTFSEEGNWQVECTVYVNGIPYTTYQCISICGIHQSNLPENISLCNGEELTLNAMNVCSLSYQWNTGDTVSSITVNSAGQYVVETTSACGIGSDTTIVTMGNCDELDEIANVFSPNGDSINDEFEIELTSPISITYNILNRWGNVLKSNSLTFPISQTNSKTLFKFWEGNDQTGIPCSDGVYFYTIILENSQHKVTSKTGFIQLVR